MTRQIVIAIFLVLTTISCSDKSDESVRSQDDNEFIEALTYHHEFKVSAIIDDFAKNKSIDKKIKTERVAQTTNYWTPLCYACFIGNSKAVKLLIEKGANVNYKDSNGQTPLILASITGNIEEIALLLKAGADINGVDMNNSSALIHASAEGNLLTVKYLVDQGCELEPKNGGQNALDFAIFYQHQQVIDYLTEKGLKKSGT
ncbi:Protein of unknown function containing ankyrin repeat signature [Flavobacterium indicum GPTSA100-9 = DSM 17447]|uniref:Uncharacterized protein n=1 Tax=Flavobacterium indicum (strain DSM 17447 / CIP 109464 / GPTSA100-9) TaxID=1094466 RepID=H8XUH4_FLAIG|nr:ankyrin repeat domain-containing protein [Flavobacterium indicum]CCG52957.1 Protein of unknown function containing ankyrin repeat signature [Flavobacterium indicum GPTSA100-9 = DSM 17447]